MTVMNFMMCWLLWIKHPVLRHHHPSNPNCAISTTTTAICLWSIVAGVCVSERRFPRLNGRYYYYYFYTRRCHIIQSIPNGVFSLVCIQIEIRLIILKFKRELRFFAVKVHQSNIVTSIERFAEKSLRKPISSIRAEGTTFYGVTATPKSFRDLQSFSFPLLSNIATFSKKHHENWNMSPTWILLKDIRHFFSKLCFPTSVRHRMVRIKINNQFDMTIHIVCCGQSNASQIIWLMKWVSYIQQITK